MDQSTKTKPVRSAAGKEKRASYSAAWLKGQRRIYMQAQAHETRPGPFEFLKRSSDFFFFLKN